MNDIEIDTSLSIAKQVLKDNADIYNKTTDEILDLYEEDKNMLHARWCIAAYVLLSKIQCFDTITLIKNLSSEKAGSLLFELSGYILQKEYNVDLEELIIESDKHGEYDKIIRYVISNLQYRTGYNFDNITAFLDVINKHSENNENNKLINDYSKYICNSKAFYIVKDKLKRIKNNSEFLFLSYLASDWYKNDHLQADEYCEKCLLSNELLNKRIAIYYLSYSIYYNTDLFETRIIDVDKSYDSGNDIRYEIITLFIKYLKDIQNKTTKSRNIILKRLNAIPTDTPDTKMAFIDRITYIKEMPKDLLQIYKELIQRPLCNDELLTSINNFLYVKIKKSNYTDVLQDLLIIFKVNNYTTNYYSFFNHFSSVLPKLNKYYKNTSGLAFSYLISDDINEVFFGLGLVERTPNIINNINAKKLSFSEKQIIQVLKAFLYFSLDVDLICSIAFVLLNLCNQVLTDYINFCEDELYENYSAKMYDFSRKHYDNMNEKQKELANIIIDSFETCLEKQKNVQKVMDMRPSVDHMRVISKAKISMNQKIQNKAESMSFAARLFPMQKMKYGNRFSYVIKQGQGTKVLQESSYHIFTTESLLPMIYVIDPVQFFEKREAFFEEVKSNEIDN